MPGGGGEGGKRERKDGEHTAIATQLTQPHSHTATLWSGVKDSGPQTVDLMPVSPMMGTLLMWPSMWALKTSQSKSNKEKANESSTCTPTWWC